MALKMKYNIGWFKSGEIYAPVYLVENADTGKQYTIQAHDHDANTATAIKWLPMDKSVIETMIAQNLAVIAAAIPYTSLEETVPSGQKDVDGYVLVDNVPTVVADINAYRILNANTIAMFSKKGLVVDSVPTNLQAVTAQNLQLWKSGLLTTTTTTTVVATAATGTTGTTTGTTATSYTGIAIIDNVIAYAVANPLISALVIFGALEFFGVTNVLGFKKKRRR